MVEQKAAKAFIEASYNRLMNPYHFANLVKSEGAIPAECAVQPLQQVGGGEEGVLEAARVGGGGGGGDGRAQSGGLPFRRRGALVSVDELLSGFVRAVRRRARARAQEVRATRIERAERLGDLAAQVAREQLGPPRLARAHRRAARLRPVAEQRGTPANEERHAPNEGHVRRSADGGREGCLADHRGRARDRALAQLTMRVVRERRLE